MKKIKKLMIAAVVGIFAVSITGCKMITKSPEAIRKTVVAKVGDDTVTKGEFDDAMQSVINQFKTQYGSNYESNSQAKAQFDQQKQQTLEQLIAKKVVFLKAKELKLMPSDKELDKEVNKQLTDIKNNIAKQSQDKSKSADAKFNDALKQQGYTVDKLKSEIRDNIIQKKVYDYATKGAKVSDKEIQDYYDQNKTLEFTEKPDQLHAEHILVDTEDKAKAVKAEIDKGAKFEDVAKKESSDTGSKDKGGDLGMQPYSSLDKDFVKGAIALKPGQVSNPVKSQFGWHIIKLISKEEYPFKKLADVKKDINDKLIDQKKQSLWQSTVSKWESQVKIKRYSDRL